MNNFIGLIVCNLIFLILAYGINKNNAELLLAGYNTMSKEMKDAFNIDKYLIFLKKFFIYLTLYSTMVFFVTRYFFNIRITAIAYAIFLIIAFIYFIIISNSNKFKNSNYNE